MDDPNLRDASAALQKSRARHFLAHGTLLGLIREGDFLAWDEEIDFALVDVTDIEREQIEIRLIKMGFLVEAKSPQNTHVSRPGGNKVDLNFYNTVAKETSSGEYEQEIQIEWEVPAGPKAAGVFAWKLDGVIHRLSTGTSPTNALKRIAYVPLFKLKRVFLPTLLLSRRFVGLALKTKSVSYRIPSHLSETKHYEIANYSVVIPNQPEMVLQALYGPGWRTPQRSSVWWQFAKP